MTAQEQNDDVVVIPKDTFQCMISDFGHLLEDFESITEAKTMKLAEKRLNEIRTGKVKPRSEKEFREFMKKENEK
ncbi:MAG: hypothetical protein KAS12_03160 [Candidatus Aenigmarchaeota archaeon]|nr:hypothetical protein [Candidatus Aenigmarchaeota archaeon]